MNINPANHTTTSPPLNPLPDRIKLQQLADYVELFKGRHTQNQMQQLMQAITAIDQQSLSSRERTQCLRQCAYQWQQWMHSVYHSADDLLIQAIQSCLRKLIAGPIVTDSAAPQ